MQPSWDGKTVLFGCNSIPVGASQPTNIVTPRVVAVLEADGSVNTKNHFVDSWTNGTGTTFIRSVASLDSSSGFWVSGAAGGGVNNGIKYLPNVGGRSRTVTVHNSSLLAAGNNVRIVTIGPNITGQPQLFSSIRDPVGSRGIHAVGSGVSSGEQQASTLLPGYDILQTASYAPIIVQFVLEPDGRTIWTADAAYFLNTAISPSFSIVGYTYAPAFDTWVRNVTIYVTGTQTQSLTGRMEDGVFMLYT